MQGAIAQIIRGLKSAPQQNGEMSYEATKSFRNLFFFFIRTSLSWAYQVIFHSGFQEKKSHFRRAVLPTS
jgi:hypothetical protein